MRRWYAIALFLCALIVLTAPITAKAQIDINITVAPPELPIYEQPPLPEPGYIWAPGYWAWGPDGYYWVPGTWVLPPDVGLLWTPGYWGWHDGIYAWNDGYWGPQVGFYGGVNYGFGYGGDGYAGGRWNNGVFAYNRTVNNFGGVHITNVYSETVVVNSNVRTSFNGGSGGLTARPTAEQQAFAHEQHTPPTAMQTQHQHTASTNRGLLASENHGQPTIAATSKPNEFSGKGVMAARPVSGGTGGGVTGGRPENFNANRTPGTNTPNALEKKGPGGNPAALTNTGAPPKTLNNEHMNTQHVNTQHANTEHMNGSTPPPHPPAPHPPQPHIVSAPKPPPHPPAPHPQARPAPHPNNDKKHG
jgi:WXXGXW repeat (2 copies)